MIKKKIQCHKNFRISFRNFDEKVPDNKKTYNKISVAQGRCYHLILLLMSFTNKSDVNKKFYQDMETSF